MRKLFLVCACLLLAISCQAEIITVDDDGLADFKNIQDAINYSWHGDTIVVKPGIYNENVYFNSRAITVTGEDPNDPNIVESTIITISSGYSVTFDFGEGTDSALTGFTITGRGIHCYASSPTITKNIITDCDDTEGVYGKYDAAPTISYNVITNNAPYGLRGCHGLIIGNTISYNNSGLVECDGEIRDNEITGNTGGYGGVGLHNCNGTITNNIISNNRTGYEGGGLEYCDGEIIENIIIGNRALNGGALSRCHANVRDNVIVGNEADYAGGGLYYCNGAISSNIITGNKSKNGNDGGGLYCCNGTIMNNTIAGNMASNRGGAMYGCGGSACNNIIAFNEAILIGGIYGACDNSFNALWMNEGGNFGGGAIAGPGDICLNPLFALDGYWSDPCNTPSDSDDDIWVDGDYHLKSQAGRWDSNSQSWVQDDVNSPCIDAGDPNSDWAGELWPHGKRINMGAYGGTPEASMSPLGVGNIADLNNDGIVNFQDFALLADSWQAEKLLSPEDINRDNQVNGIDLSIFTNNWLWEQ